MKKWVGIILSIIFVIILLVLLIPKKEKYNNGNSNIPENQFLGDSSIFYNSNNVGYDNTESGISSSTVRDAIDELYDSIVDGCYVGYTIGESSATEYRCNKSSSNSSLEGEIEAENARYDNSNGLIASNVQGAIDELASKISYCRNGFYKDNETSSGYDCLISTLPSTLSITNNVVNLTYGGSSEENAYTYDGDGVVSCTSSDTTKVTCNVDAANNKIIVTPVVVTTQDVTITVKASETINYYAPTDVTFAVNVAPRVLIANTPSCSNKTYNRNTTASCTISYSNVVSGDSVTGGATCTFADANVGTNKTVTCSSFTKSGTGNANYAVPSGSKTTTANITALTLIANTPSCSNKTYNRNTTASCTISYSNVISGDSVTGGATCTFADANVGTNKTVTCSSFTKSGTGNANYTVPSGSKTTTANITAKTLTANTPSCSNKTYNGNTAASCTISYSNVISGDSVTGGATCTFADANVGNGKTVTCSSFTKSGTGNANYAVPSGSKTTTANITAQACNAPTGVSISTAGKVTWTASSNCSGGQHQVSINNSSWTNASSGVDYKSTIIASTGTRTVYVRVVAPSSNYSTSSSGSASTTVYSVSLTKGTGVSSVTGAGNYIKGSTATINATMASHYIWSKWTGTPATSTQKYSAAVNGNWSATANATNLCASTTDKPACGNYGGCSVTYKQQSGTKTRSCTHKYYSNVSGYTSHLCSTGTTYNNSASCNGATDACASGSTYDSPSCGNYGSCSVSCSDQTGTMTRSCTHKYYSNKISGLLCSTGSAYNDSTSCTGSQSCGSWHLRFNYSDVGTCGYTCPRFCSEEYSTSTWSCTAQTSDPSSASQRSGRNCWCKY